MRARRYQAFGLLAAVAIAALLTFRWLSAAADQAAAVSVARQFVDLLRVSQWERAFALTAPSSLVGRSPAELSQVSAREFCPVERVVATSPRQTNGNRLRRWLAGAEVDMAEVRVEFEGRCLLGVTLRHQPDGQWRVSRFASHAG